MASGAAVATETLAEAVRHASSSLELKRLSTNRSSNDVLRGDARRRPTFFAAC